MLSGLLKRSPAACSAPSTKIRLTQVSLAAAHTDPLHEIGCPAQLRDSCRSLSPDHSDVISP